MPDADEVEQGLITMIYDNNQRGLRSILLNIQHEFNEIIRTSFSSPLDGNRRIEIILLLGYDRWFRSLEDRLTSQIGVESVELRIMQSKKIETN